jgi:hypothetical protein
MILTIKKSVSLSTLSLCMALVLSACGGGGSSSDLAPGTINPAAAPSTNTPTATLDPITDSIALFTLDITPFNGVSLQYIYPIALFKDGRALTNTAALLYAPGLEAHRAKYPGAWTQWRKNGAQVQLLQGNGSWKDTKLGSAQLAPTNTRLAKAYASFYLTPNIAGTSSSSTSYYTFTAAGGVIRGKYSISMTPDVMVSSVPPENRGTYTIDGYRLTIKYDNGVKSESVIVLEPDLSRIYIDGSMYSLD